jgi:hypothetical protein
MTGRKELVILMGNKVFRRLVPAIAACAASAALIAGCSMGSSAPSALPDEMSIEEIKKRIVFNKGFPSRSTDHSFRRRRSLLLRISYDCSKIR